MNFVLKSRQQSMVQMGIQLQLSVLGVVVNHDTYLLRTTGNRVYFRAIFK